MSLAKVTVAIVVSNYLPARTISPSGTDNWKLSMMMSTDSRLAINGGSPVRTRRWPDWPRPDAGMQRNVLDALHSSKWAISGVSERTYSYERRFGEAFAAFCGVSYGVPCSSGTAALTIGLQALGVGPGDEVIVPGLTWVACASSVCNVGAVPVLVDVDSTLCLSPPLVEAAITSRTRAIMGVHLYSSFADVDALTAISKRHGVALLEDCSQAHGATLRSQRAGSFGIIGAFSLQQSKLLTAGEGGISVTNDVTLYDRMQQFRADGRRYRRTPPVSRWDFWELEYAGDVAGRNLCLNELSAAAALAGLERLDGQNALRKTNFQLLREKVKTIEGFRFIETADRCTTPTFYRLCGRIQPSLLRGRSIEDVATALTAELRLPIERIDRALNEHPLYQPLKHPAVAALGSEAVRFDPSQFSLPEAEASSRSCVGIPHQCLLGDESDIDDLVEAISKVLL